jgi:hypothetical protein
MLSIGHVGWLHSRKQDRSFCDNFLNTTKLYGVGDRPAHVQQGKPVKGDEYFLLDLTRQPRRWLLSVYTHTHPWLAWVWAYEP